MIDLVWVGLAAFGASVVTFFSGFGLGTLLTPVMMVFFPVEIAIAATGLVHFANNIFKVILTGSDASLRVLITFGLPAILAAIAGSWLLLQIPESEPIATYRLADHVLQIYPLKLMMGLLLILFALLELIPYFARLEFSPRMLPVGGLLSGFFGGLAGVQGALRSAFLIRAGLSKEAFIGTAVMASTLVDLTRLSIYARAIDFRGGVLKSPVIWIAVVAAMTGALAGQRLLRKVTIRTLQLAVAWMLIAMGSLFVLGIV